jgi:hypothetical protein
MGKHAFDRREWDCDHRRTTVGRIYETHFRTQSSTERRPPRANATHRIGPGARAPNLSKEYIRLGTTF